MKIDEQGNAVATPQSTSASVYPSYPGEGNSGF
jgi:hypothetical protein